MVTNEAPPCGAKQANTRIASLPLGPGSEWMGMVEVANRWFLSGKEPFMFLNTYTEPGMGGPRLAFENRNANDF
jgi:hypothetical protein